jgi:hypothetical protein
MGRKKSEIGHRHSYEEILRLAEIGEAVMDKAPALVEWLTKKPRKRRRVNGEPKIKAVGNE